MLDRRESNNTPSQSKITAENEFTGVVVPLSLKLSASADSRGLRSIHFSHSLAAPLCGLGLFFLLLDARFVIEATFLDLRKESFFGELFLEISNGFFDLVILNNDFHGSFFLPPNPLLRGVRGGGSG